MEKYDVYSYLQQIMHLSFLQEYNKLRFINSCTLKEAYRNFRSFTRMADYPHRPIIVYGEKKSQQITRTGG